MTEEDKNEVLFTDEQGREVVRVGEVSSLVLCLGTETTRCKHGGVAKQAEVKAKGGIFKLGQALLGNRRVVGRIESSLNLGHLMFEHHALGVDDIRFLREMTDTTDGTNRRLLEDIAKSIATALAYRGDRLRDHKELDGIDSDAVLADLITMMPAKSAAVILMAMSDAEISQRINSGQVGDKMRGIDTKVRAGMAFLLLPEVERRDILAAFPALGMAAREAGYTMQRTMILNITNQNSPYNAMQTFQRVYGQEALVNISARRQESNDWPDLVDPGRLFRDASNRRQVR